MSLFLREDKPRKIEPAASFTGFISSVLYNKLRPPTAASFRLTCQFSATIPHTTTNRWPIESKPSFKLVNWKTWWSNENALFTLNRRHVMPHFISTLFDDLLNQLLFESDFNQMKFTASFSNRWIDYDPKRDTVTLFL